MHNNGSTPSSYIFFLWTRSLALFPSLLPVSFNFQWNVRCRQRDIQLLYICINTCLFTLHYILLSSQQYPCAPFSFVPLHPSQKSKQCIEQHNNSPFFRNLLLFLQHCHYSSFSKSCVSLSPVAEKKLHNMFLHTSEQTIIYRFAIVVFWLVPHGYMHIYRQQNRENDMRTQDENSVGK